MSLRARLALVLAGVLAGPVVAAGLVVAVVVPRARADAETATLRHALAATSAYLAQRCAGLGDVARAAALDLSADLTDGRTLDAGRAREAAVAALAGHPDAAVLVTAGTRVVASAGGGVDAAELPGLLVASCSRGAGPTPGAPAQVEAVPVTDGSGTEVARVVAVGRLDTAALAGLRGRLGLGAGLAVVAHGRPVAASGVPPRLLAGAAGVTGGVRYQEAPPDAGVPYTLVTWTPTGAGGLPLALVVLALAALAACGVLLLVVTTRLTRPLLGLAQVAARLRQGDLSARGDVAVPAGSRDEVAEVAVTLDTMAGRLADSAEEMEAGRAALAGSAVRLGEALARTHDLDGLLQTVLDAARDAGDAAAGAALLGEARALEERAVTTVTGAPASPATLDRLAGLARLAIERDGTVRSTDPLPGLAVPLRQGTRLAGALALVRGAGSPAFDDAVCAAVEALASAAGIAVGNVLEHEETRRLSVTDALTGAGNFRHLSTTLAREVERATRFNRPLSVVMLDLDHFKGVNDAHGHAFGDGVLREFARRLQDCLREVDTVARYGGEEFAVVLPETGSDGAAAVTARIVAAVRAGPFTVGDVSQPVTASAGVASFPDHGRTASEILRAADAALYVAKSAGRDRWCLAEIVLPGQEHPDAEAVGSAGAALADVPAARPGGSG